MHDTKQEREIRKAKEKLQKIDRERTLLQACPSDLEETLPE